MFCNGNRMLLSLESVHQFQPFHSRWYLNYNMCRTSRLQKWIKHDQTWSNMIKHDQTWSNMIKHDQTWSNMIKHDQSPNHHFLNPVLSRHRPPPCINCQDAANLRRGAISTSIGSIGCHQRTYHLWGNEWFDKFDQFDIMSFTMFHCWAHPCSPQGCKTVSQERQQTTKTQWRKKPLKNPIHRWSFFPPLYL